MPTPKKILLVHKRAPGDTLVLTGLIRDIALSYPGQFQVGFRGSAPDLLRHNPHLAHFVPAEFRKEVDVFPISYGEGLRDQNSETVHFLPYFHRVFNARYGTNVRVHEPYPDVHLSPAEDQPIVSGRYWVVLSGGKSDFTAKVWETTRFRQLVSRSAELGIQFVQAGSSDPGHWHPELPGALDLVGRTNLRDMIRLLKYADGVVCGVTMSMHLAAALQRPCVVLGGGREAWWWEAYVTENKGLVCPERLRVPHRYLHTIGLLSCCERHGCWKNKTVQLGKDKSLCKDVVHTSSQPIPRCMDMISVDTVLDAMRSYYLDGTLPSIPGTKLAEEIEGIKDGRLVHG